MGTIDYTAFVGHRRLAQGDLLRVARAAKREIQATRNATVADPLLVFDDRNGAQVDLDLSGDERALRRRYGQMRASVDENDNAVQAEAAAKRGRGRPRLGVVAREVTLLPRHWEWLAAQPGGASVTLRKLVEEARRTNAGTERRRQAQEAAYRFMSAIAGNAAGFEEAARALFAGDHEAFMQSISKWPMDVRDYASRFAADAFDGANAGRAGDAA